MLEVPMEEEMDTPPPLPGPPPDDFDEKVGSVRQKILKICKSNMTMLLSEKEMRGRVERQHKILEKEFVTKQRADAVLETLQRSGDLVPLDKFPDGEAVAAEFKYPEYQHTRKELRLTKKLEVKEGVTPLSEAKAFIVEKANKLLGRPEKPKIFVAVHSLEMIAEETKRLLAYKCWQLRTRKGLLLQEDLHDFYNQHIKEAFTRTRLHLHLTSRGLLQFIPQPGRQEIIRIVKPGESLVTPEDLQHCWLQWERMCIEKELKSRQSKRDNEPLMNPLQSSATSLPQHEPVSSCQRAHGDLVEEGNLSRLSDAELEDRLKDGEEEILQLDIKYYPEHPEDWEKQIVRAVSEGRDRITPNINLIHQIFSTASPVAPQLWNIYQYLNRSMGLAVTEMPNFVWNNTGIDSVNDIIRAMFSVQEYRFLNKAVNGICCHAIRNVQLGTPVLPVNLVNDNQANANVANQGVANPEQVNPNPANHAPVNPDQANPVLAHFDPANPQYANPGLACIAVAVHIIATLCPELVPLPPSLSSAPEYFQPYMVSKILHEIVNLGVTDRKRKFSSIYFDAAYFHECIHQVFFLGQYVLSLYNTIYPPPGGPIINSLTQGAHNPNPAQPELGLPDAPPAGPAFANPPLEDNELTRPPMWHTFGRILSSYPLEIEDDDEELEEEIWMGPNVGVNGGANNIFVPDESDISDDEDFEDYDQNDAAVQVNDDNASDDDEDL